MIIMTGKIHELDEYNSLVVLCSKMCRSRQFNIMFMLISYLIFVAWFKTQLIYQIGNKTRGL